MAVNQRHPFDRLFAQQEGLGVNEVRILRHALASFAARGYAGTNMRSIAAAAGVTAPMVNYYFKSKEALYLRLTVLVMEALDAEVRVAVEGVIGLRAELRALLVGHVRFAVASPEALGFLLGLVYGPHEGRPEVNLTKPYSVITDRIRRTFERGIASGELALRPGVALPDAIAAYQTLVDSLVHQTLKERFSSKRGAEEVWQARAVQVDARLAILFEGIGRAT